jgi:hypothetical protein
VLENLKGRNNLWEAGMVGRIILKSALKECEGVDWINLTHRVGSGGELL